MFKKTPKAPKVPKPPKIKVQKTRKIGNRTLIGILSIVVALLICFGVAPVINRVADSKTEIVRVRNLIPKGTCINESDLETVTVGAYNLPENVIRKKADAVGKYATGDLYAGDWILPGNLTEDPDSATDILDSLGNDRKAMSVTIGSFAQGLSGKLETGDIISVIVYSNKDAFAFTPPELQYLRVITSTTSQGVDKSDVTDATQPVTVTLLVNQAQAEHLPIMKRPPPCTLRWNTVATEPPRRNIWTHRRSILSTIRGGGTDECRRTKRSLRSGVLRTQEKRRSP